MPELRPTKPNTRAATPAPTPPPQAPTPKTPIAVPLPSAHTSMQPEALSDRLSLVRHRVAAAAKRAGRAASDIIVVAVTKHAEPEQIREIIHLGHTDLGENRVQQLIQHASMVEEFQSRLKVLPTAVKNSDAAESLFEPPAKLPRPAGTPGSAGPIRWHMIGHLQRNKAKKVVEFVRLIHAVDSLRIAEELQTIALKRDSVIDVLVQVNCSGENSKFGCPVPAAMPLAEQISTMINIRVRGLMTMAPYSENPEDARPTFARCRELFEEIKSARVVDGPFNILSMGMSGDFEVAIEEGANIVRVGTALFGEPKVPTEADED